MEPQIDREFCEQADKAFSAIFNAQKTIGYGTMRDVHNAGVKDVSSVIGWLKKQGHISDMYGNRALGKLEACGNPQFTKEWDKREEEKSAAESTRLLKEEREKKEWELKIRAEERDIAKVELQRSQRDLQRRTVWASIISLIVGALSGVMGMLLKSKQ